MRSSESRNIFREGEHDFGDGTREAALALDAEDPLRQLREEFIIPSKKALESSKLPPVSESLRTESSSDPCIYLCGNSLGLQPRVLLHNVQIHLDTWATKGVYGHFTQLDDSPQPPFLHVDAVAAEQMSHVVGALPGEVAVMETLTANLHLLMASFYRPDARRWKIILEGKAFPSDHYAVESQIRHHGLDPKDAMVLIEPADVEADPTLSTSQILAVIDEHATSAALLLLPGIQYYTGQYFDIPAITAHAHSKGLLVGWDLAHAAGNVPLGLHEWEVDFAAWCTYKYLNAGPGAIAALFVHEKHGTVDLAREGGYRPRLAGWWGGDKSVRFRMESKFTPMPGAAGYQVGNPSALAITALAASLSVFSKTSVAELRKKSLLLTAYLAQLLAAHAAAPHYRIITPAAPGERGAQLSIRLAPGLLQGVAAALRAAGAVVDERRPDVVRAAPAPLYNSFADVWDFVHIFGGAVSGAVDERRGAGGEGGE
ncbi:MAG: Kynureninase (L-kynurenine hydrolase) [Thelocarpon impressellum]|nr:MAG: Kynureninase (L-kynurenine hydrolase) [Thelocarpon impressellum]